MDESDGDLPDPTANNPLVGYFLDRSGHSAFNRMLIKSQGNELERIE